MYVGLSKEHEALRDELRAYYDKLLTPEVEEDLRAGEGVGQVSKDTWKQMASDGYAGVGWPKEWGGKGLTPIEQFVFFDESMRAGAPVPMLTINSVAPTIMRYGSEEQKQFYVPKILAGEIHFAIGYTEPDAGTDLASLKTTAVRDGDEYIINGQKVCTNQEVKKHKGISIIIVPTDTPGFRYVPIDNFGATNTNVTYYDDVRVPVGNLVGDENGGWGLITNQLNHERVTLCSSGVVERMLDDVRGWAQQTKLADGRRVIDQEWVQLNFARVRAGIEALTLMNWKAATAPSVDPAFCSAIKVYGTEFYIQAYRLLMEIMGQRSTLGRGSPLALLEGHLERACQGTLILTFGGGVNEVQRDLISLFGLGMPRTPRM